MEQRYVDTDVLPQTFSILHVDGDLLMRKILKKILSDELFSLDSASNGKEAFLFLNRKQYTYDVVITEMHMLYANGYEIVNKIRERAPGCLIIITSNTSFLHIREGLDLEQENYFKKPLVVGKLVERIRAIQLRGAKAVSETVLYTSPTIRKLSSVFENEVFNSVSSTGSANGTELILDEVPVDLSPVYNHLHRPLEPSAEMAEGQIVDGISLENPVAVEVKPAAKFIKSPGVSIKRWW